MPNAGPVLSLNYLDCCLKHWQLQEIWLNLLLKLPRGYDDSADLSSNSV